MRKWRSNRNDVRPLVVLDPVRPQLDPKQETLTELRKLVEQVVVDSEAVKSQPIIDATGLTRSPLKSRAPLYRRGFHKKGDLVRMPGSNIEVVVPELDGEGQPVPEI